MGLGPSVLVGSSFLGDLATYKFYFFVFVMDVMHERKVLIGLSHHSHNDFLTTLHGLPAPASTDVKNTGGNRSTIRSDPAPGT